MIEVPLCRRLSYHVSGSLARNLRSDFARPETPPVQTRNVGANDFKNTPHDTYPVRCRVPGHSKPCSERVCVGQLKKWRQFKNLRGVAARPEAPLFQTRIVTPPFQTQNAGLASGLSLLSGFGF